MNGIGLDPVPGLTRLTPETTYMVSRNGTLKHQRISLNRMRMVVGRHDPPNVTVDIDLSAYELGETPMISRRHAVLQWHQGQLQLLDLGSRNGTVVDGQTLTPRAEQSHSAPVTLKAGSMIRFGNLDFEVITHE
jgi:pSer/pThr/pTyr-binding forkhead associated (FHA) protein